MGNTQLLGVIDTLVYLLSYQPQADRACLPSDFFQIPQLKGPYKHPQEMDRQTEKPHTNIFPLSKNYYMCFACCVKVKEREKERESQLIADHAG